MKRRSLKLTLPKDLLERVQGVEEGLRRGQSIEKAGWGAFIVTGGSMLVWVANNWGSLPSFLEDSTAFWPVLIAVAAIVLIVMLINWTRIWVRAPSRLVIALN